VSPAGAGAGGGGELMPSHGEPRPVRPRVLCVQRWTQVEPDRHPGCTAAAFDRVLTVLNEVEVIAWYAPNEWMRAWYEDAEPER